MSTFVALFACQLFAAVAALVFIGRRTYTLLVIAPLDAKCFTRALTAYLEPSMEASARSLAKRMLPAYCAELALVTLDARSAGLDARATLLETLDDLRERASESIFVVRTLGRIAPPLAFAAAIVELGGGFGRDTGLLALQRGLAESIAVSHAMLSVITGMAVSLICRFCAGLLSRWAHALAADLKLTADALSSIAAPQ